MIAPLVTMAVVISPVLVSGYFARRSAVRQGYYDKHS